MGNVTSLTGGELGAESQQPNLRETALQADAPRESVGQSLRAARLRRGDDLAHVSQALRIRKAYLEALESDSPHNLPGHTYGIGFVRAYATYLGLDTLSLVSRYKQATAGLPEGAPQVGPAPETSGFRFGFGWSLAALAAASLLLYGIYELSRPPLPIAPKLANAAPMATRTHTTAKAVGAHPALPPVPSAAAPAPADTSVATATGQVFGLQNRGARVVLHVVTATHILVQGPDGKVYINRILHPGDAYRVPNLVGLSLTTADGGAVTLELDGRDVGVAGNSGRIAEAISLNPAALAGRNSAAVPGAGDRVTP